MTQGWNDESSSSTAQTAKQEASHVASTASEQASQVAGTVQEQGAKVAAEAADQARNLLGEARTQINQQAGGQKERAASSLRTLAEELQSMSSGTLDLSSTGVGTDLVEQASQHVRRAADWLESKDAEGVLNDVRNWARRNPGTFLLAAAGAGMVAGRLTRATTQAVRSQQSSDQTATYSSTDFPAVPLTPPLDAPTAPESVPSTGYSTTGYSSPAPSAYGTEATETYAAPDTSGQPSTYGQPGTYGQPSTYGQPGAYGEEPTYGQEPQR